MFEQSILENRKSRRPWTVAVAFVAEAAVIGALLLIPMLYVNALPMPELTATLLAPPPPPPPPPPPAPPAAKVQRIVPRKFNPGQLVAPRTIPKEVLQADIAPPLSLPENPAMAYVPGGIPGGVAGGVPGGILNTVHTATPPQPPPPPPPAAAPATPSRIHVGGEVQAAKIEKEIDPSYPRLARDARIEGTVRLSAVIAKNGSVENLKLISGQPLLVPAAMDAVKQWIYRPTILNGNPVEVDTEIDVHFTLAT